MIIVLDFGGQYAHLIARRVRELGSYSEILPYNTSVSKISKLEPRGIILSGGPSSVYEKDAPIINKDILVLDIPILGICYGHQLLAELIGAKIIISKNKQYGRVDLSILEKNGIFCDLKSKESGWFSHSDKVSSLPKDFKIIASTKNCEIAAYRDNKNRIFGLQFHPEVMHTPPGYKILENFIYKICKEEKNWIIKNVHNKLISEIKKQVKDDLVLIGVSGGVDSLVAATLLHKVIEDKLYCIFIDTGLMRKNEVAEIENFFNNMHFKYFYIIDAQDKFLSNLKGVIDPEKKRKIIGHTFIRVFEKTAKNLEKGRRIKFLAQGTIYPDRIESAQASKNSSKIKSHHNITLPEKFTFQIIEPLEDLYKDEVRELGKILTLPQEVVLRHPFPGPGLAIRILGEVTKERLSILQEADFIYINELKKADLYNKIWQAFAALIPVKSVGVMGDKRTYEYIITLRAVTSKDGMTADWYKIPNSILEKISNNIINKVPEVNRVLFDISQKPPSTIEYE